jgi:hypothetical protein
MIPAIRNLPLLILLLLPPAVPGNEDGSKTCKPVIEMNAAQRILFVRPHENAFMVCTLSQNRLRELIHDFFNDSENNDAGYNTVFMGRLIDHPWISRYLAQKALGHGNWDSSQGKPVTGFINHFVSDLLTEPEFTDRMQEVFAGTGYTVTGASVEKVLVARADEIAWLEINQPELVPYDALVHFRLKKSGHY